MNTSVARMSFDWESLGRHVRQRTLEAVALHFAVMAAVHDANVAGDGAEGEESSE